MLLNNQILSPIAGYLSRANKELAIDMGCFKIVEKDVLNDNLWSSNYEISNKILNSIVIANKPIVNIELRSSSYLFGGSSAQDLILKLSVVYNDINTINITLDFLILVLDYGLNNKDIAFNGCWYIGAYGLINRSTVTEIKNNGLLTGSVLVKFKMRKNPAFK